MTQFIPQDERPLPAFASPKAPFRNSLVDFCSADSSKCAGLGNREAFPLHRLWDHVVLHPCSRTISRTRAEDGPSNMLSQPSIANNGLQSVEGNFRQGHSCGARRPPSGLSF